MLILLTFFLIVVGTSNAIAEEHSINVSSLENGTIEVAESALVGDSVTLTLKPDSGYSLRPYSLTIIDVYGNNIYPTYEQKSSETATIALPKVAKFKMPNSSVAINAEFTKGALYTQTSNTTIKVEGIAPVASIAMFENTYENFKEQIKDYKFMTYIVRGYAGKTIEAITLRMHSNINSGAGNMSIKIGDSTIAEIQNKEYYTSGITFDKWYDAGYYASSYIDVHVKFLEGANLVVGENEDIIINIDVTVNSLFCRSVFIEWNNGSYTRDSLTAERFGTICLDKGGVVKSGGTLYEIAYRDDSGIYMDEVTRMEAGVPYIFQATDTELVIAHDETTATEPINRNGLYGTFTEISDVAAVSAEKTEYILVNNEISECQSGCKVPANRAYLILDEIPIDEKPVQQGRRRIGMSVQGENQTTGMENTIAPAVEGVYDIMGRKIAEPAASGFYIINGKKVFVAL